MKLTHFGSSGKDYLEGPSCAPAPDEEGMLTPTEAKWNFADKKEKSILDFSTKSLQNILTISLFSPPQNDESFKS